MDKIENVEVVRSYSQTVQLKPFEPVSYFSSYKAVVRTGATPKEIQGISDHLIELAEEDVLSKINPSKMISRRVTLAEIRAKNAILEKKVTELEQKLNSSIPF